MWSKLQSSQQVCLNMTKQASGPPEPNKQTCPNMSAHRLSNMFVKTWLKQASGPPEPKSKARKLVCKLDKTMPVLLHQIAAAATLYSSTRRVQRSVQLLPLIELLPRVQRSVQLPSVQSEMAETSDLKSLGQFSNNRTTIARRVLKGLSEGTIVAKPPPPFQDTRGSNFRLLSNDDIANQWIRFGMPPVVVYSAYFANTRYTSEATS